jgi:antitoxin (DNA-binding transcriptional repressor) of toxin-antitoxin stability system
MVVTASALRQNIYRLLDRVLETGEPLEIERNGRRLRVVPADVPNKLDLLEPHPGTWVGDPEDIFHMDWLREWKPFPDEDEEKAADQDG